MQDNRPRIYSAVATALIVLIVLSWMACSHLTYEPGLTPDDSASAIALADEFVDVEEIPAPTASDLGNDASASATAQLPEPSDAQAQPAPESGTDISDSGSKGIAEPPLSTDDPSDMKVKEKKQDKKTGQEVDRKKAEEEKIRRQANSQVQNAFAGDRGKHNTRNGINDEDNAGKPEGKARQGNLSGRGTGSVGGGWSIPRYAAVPSSVTGSVKMVVKIDRNGRVTSVTLNGGEAPAATNRAVCQACIAEVKSRRFTRPNAGDAPETATAYITYNFH